MDGKWQRLAKILVNYSTRVQPGEIALVHCIDDVPEELVDSLLAEIFKAGGQALIWLDRECYLKQLINNANEQALTVFMEDRLAEIKKVQVVFHLYSETNACEYSDIDAERKKFYLKLNRPIVDWRCNKTKRVLTCLPNKAAAQLANMSTAEFEKFYFDVCLGVDYPAMAEAMDILVARMNATDKVYIVGPSHGYASITDLNFSIKGITAIKCPGRENFPDGEVFTAPVRNSVNGTINFNTPTSYGGNQFDSIRLVFVDGKIVDADCQIGTKQKLNEVFNTDDNSRYVGEFALGLNPRVTRAVGEILFDEKIAGSLHFTPGSCYPEASNGNDDCAIHWDLVLRQTADCGGGSIYFDGELIRQDGLFLGDLAVLNPENLKV